MKDFNFDKMKNYQVSDEWADRVIDAASGIRPRSGRNTKLIASCLCLTFVCIVSVMFFGYTKDNGAIVPVASQSSTNTEEKFTSPTVNQSTQPEKQNEQTHVPSATANNNIVPPTKAPNSTQSGHEKPTLAPSVKPSQTPEPTEVKPTTPTEMPTQAPTITPTQDPKPEDPTEMLSGDCVVSFSPSYLVGSGKIYCRIKDVDKKSVGDKNLFSDEHLARFYSGFGSIYYYLYSPQAKGVVLEPGIYYYYFYNEHGVPILNLQVEVR